MIPQRYAHLVFSLILSGFMSCLVSLIASLKAHGLGMHLPPLWMATWLSSWIVAYPSVLVVAPVARKITGRLTRPDPVRV